MADEELDLDGQMFLIENIAVANLLIDDVLKDLEDGMAEEDVHVKLLDHCYSAHEEQGVTVAAFQNLAATAVLLLAIERKKGKS